MNLKCFGSQSGFSLIETLFALLILSVGLLAVGLLQVGAMKGNARSIGRTDAVSIAQSFIDDLKSRSLGNARLKDNGGTLDDGRAPFGGSPNPAQADFSYGTINSENGQEYTVFWNVDDGSPFAGAKTLRLFVYWTDQKAGLSSVIMTTVLGGLY